MYMQEVSASGAWASASASASDTNDIGDFADAYRDMRLDIENMSYEVKQFSFSGFRNFAFINIKYA